MPCNPQLGEDWFGPSGGLAFATGFPDPPEGYDWYATSDQQNFTGPVVNLVWDFTRDPEDPNGSAPWGSFPLRRGMMYGSAVAWMPVNGWTVVGPELTVDLADAPVMGCITVVKPDELPEWADPAFGFRWSWHLGGYPDESWHFTPGEDVGHPEFTYWEENPPLALRPSPYLFAHYYPLAHYYPPPIPCPDRPTWPYEEPYIGAGGGDGLVVRSN